MVLAVELSARRGLVPAAEVTALRKLLLAAGLPVQPPPDMSPAIFIELMGRDKKVVDGRLRLILLAALGEACIVDDVTPDELQALLG